MDKDRVKGKVKDVTGRVERQAGEWTDDSELQAKGLANQAEGKVQHAAGKIKDKVKEANENLKKRSDRDEEIARDEAADDPAENRGRGRDDRAA